MVTHDLARLCFGESQTFCLLPVLQIGLQPWDCSLAEKRKSTQNQIFEAQSCVYTQCLKLEGLDSEPWAGTKRYLFRSAVHSSIV